MPRTPLPSTSARPAGGSLPRRNPSFFRRHRSRTRRCDVGNDVTFDEDLEAYLSVALANGFSKGTANVSPRDYKKLLPLLKHYAKSPKPFTACVRDNRKRF